MEAQAVGIEYIQLTAEKYEAYKDNACHTNLATGVNVFTPIGRLLKVLRRSGGMCNSITLPHPDGEVEEEYRPSYLRTVVDDGVEQYLSLEIEAGIRDELREIAPDFAERPFAKTKYCWLKQTTDVEFLICQNPRYEGFQIATGGSLHA
ncbi:uncharacterized protein K452DRAFT_305072 [Aplosporella prunicola CBS 121167]|uniref:Uncharacterized protein n=1 Tax=Aplosporella prunicola CBS 121167 TaxID=1176127 RepID=A0A6A6BPM6_9PEZI|nr:uncharacterized protein K452DRAFT_305072 [Aplosporella prunicola CBS 121167]KAF2146089.1 hypothetical protein K452DRAFT_305072 [Aplosporella prunicola CBS 121167]